MLTIGYAQQSLPRAYSTPAKKQKSSLTELFLVGMVGFYSSLGSSGSGSLCPKKTPYTYQATPARESTISASVSEQIQHIQNGLQLNMSALAELIDVSRPSLYKWLKGESPHSDEVLRRLLWLYNQASQIIALNLVRTDALIKRPLFEGQSVFDLLKENTALAESHLKTLQDIDQKEANVRAASAKTKPIKSAQDAIDEFSTPIMRT